MIFYGKLVSKYTSAIMWVMDGENRLVPANKEKHHAERILEDHVDEMEFLLRSFLSFTVNSC